MVYKNTSIVLVHNNNDFPEEEICEKVYERSVLL